MSLFYLTFQDFVQVLLGWKKKIGYIKFVTFLLYYVTFFRGCNYGGIRDLWMNVTLFCYFFRGL